MTLFCTCIMETHSWLLCGVDVRRMVEGKGRGWCGLVAYVLSEFDTGTDLSWIVETNCNVLGCGMDFRGAGGWRWGGRGGLISYITSRVTYGAITDPL